MKYLSLLFFLIILSSCSGTKRVSENSKDVVNVVKTQETKEDTPEQIIKAAQTVNEAPIIKHETAMGAPEGFNHNAWGALLKKHVSKNGNVDYNAFKNNRKLLLNYISSLSEVMPTNSWTKQEKLAYWINAYNAMTIDLILHHYPIKSIKDIDKPWNQRFWKLGEKWYNLNDIEHQILRKMNEPRIHFAIVCASYSCPKLQNTAFTSANLEQQLTQSTKEFLSDPERNFISKNEIHISKIFQWFAKDFKSKGSLIDFLNQYSDIQISNSAKKKFKDYNWDLNE